MIIIVPADVLALNDARRLSAGPGPVLTTDLDMVTSRMLYYYDLNFKYSFVELVPFLMANDISKSASASRVTHQYVFVVADSPGGEPTKIVANVITFEM